MTKEQFLSELGRYTDTSKIRIRFSAKSKYMARRYKPEYVTWEAWLYNGKSATGYVITGDDWNINEAHNRLIVDSFTN